MIKKISLLSFFALLTLCGFLSGNVSKTAAAKHTIHFADETDEGKFALLVGIDDYTHVSKLKGAVADVKAMKTLLTDKKFGFPEKNVLMITDKDATADNIIGAFREHLINKAAAYKKKTGKEATVFFHYSGHGSQAVPPEGFMNKAEEPDGWDETIVTIDSRDKEGKNFDIRDDEIGVLVADLAKHTKNVVYIFDSCHSGTINRGQMLSREVKADTREQPAYRLPVSSKDSASSRNSDGGHKKDLLSGNNNFVLITGTRSSHLSYEMETGGISRGILSFYLERAMRNASPQTTWLELMRRVKVEVNHQNQYQDPQITGDVTRKILGGNFNEGEIPIPIVSVNESKKTILVGAGRTMGIREGSILAVHNKNSVKIGEAVVSSNLKNNEAEAVFNFIDGAPESAKIDPETDSVLLISPLFGSEPMTLYLGIGGESNARTASATQAEKVLSAVAERLGKGRLYKIENAAFETAASKSAQDAGVLSISVKRDNFRTAFCGKIQPIDATPQAKSAADEECREALPEPTTKADGTIVPLPKNEDDVFYIAPTASGEPAFKWFVSVNDPEAAKKLEEALVKFARQKNLLALENKGSRLAGKVKIEMFKTGGDFKEDGFHEDLNKEEIIQISDNTSYRLTPDVIYKLKITNTHDKQLFVTVLNLSNDGAINVMYPFSDDGQQPLMPGVTVDTDLLQTSYPLGTEYFKVIVTEQFSDYSALAQGAASKDTRTAANPLTSLMEQVMIGSRSGHVLKAPKTEQWAVEQISLEIVPK